MWCVSKVAFYVLTVKCLIVSDDQIQFRVHVRPVRVRLNLIFCSSGTFWSNLPPIQNPTLFRNPTQKRTQLIFSSNIPTNENGPIINSDRLRQAAGNGATTTTTERDRSVSLQNEISTNQSSGFEMSGQIAAIAQEKYLKRSTTVGTCQAISQSYHPTNQRPGSSQTVHRQLLAEFNQRNNESESSTSPER